MKTLKSFLSVGPLRPLYGVYFIQSKWTKVLTRKIERRDEGEAAEWSKKEESQRCVVLGDKHGNLLDTCTLCAHGKTRGNHGEMAGDRCPRERKRRNFVPKFRLVAGSLELMNRCGYFGCIGSSRPQVNSGLRLALHLAFTMGVRLYFSLLAFSIHDFHRFFHKVEFLVDLNLLQRNFKCFVCQAPFEDLFLRPHRGKSPTASVCCSIFCTSLFGQYSTNVMVLNSSHDIEFYAVMSIVWACPFYQDSAAFAKVSATYFTRLPGARELI
ncbi:hypothetical protein LXL04_007186 [Taraxacum kok-saghyz]